MKRLLALLLGVLMIFGMFAGCSSKSTPVVTEEPITTETSDATGKDIQYLRLRWSQRAGISTMFDAPMAELGCELPYMIYDALLSVIGNNGDLIPKLATKWEVSEDGKTYTFTIREGVTFSDGKPLTADDVAFTFWANVASPNNGVCGFMMREIVGADDVINNGATELSGIKVNGDTVSVTLKEANRSFLNFVGMMMILPKHCLEGVAATDLDTCSFWEHPIGTGAYVFDEINFPDYVTLVRNENYWGEPAGIEHVLFTNYADAAACEAALISGDLDWGGAADVESANNLIAQNPDLAYRIVPQNYVRYFVFNEIGATDGQQNPGMTDVRVRQAISMIIDREAIASMYGALAEVRTTFVPNNHPLYNDDIAPFERDVAGALKLLKEANFDFSKKIRICYYYDDQTTIDIMDMVCANLAEAGITAEAFCATGDLGNILYTVHNYDMLYCGWTKDDPIDIYLEVQADGGEEAIQDGHDYRMTNFNDNMNAYRAAMDFDVAKGYADAVQAAGVESCYFFPVYGLNALQIYNAGKINVPQILFERNYSYNKDYMWSEWSLVG